MHVGGPFRTAVRTPVAVPIPARPALIALARAGMPLVALVAICALAVSRLVAPVAIVPVVSILPANALAGLLDFLFGCCGACSDSLCAGPGNC